MPTPTFIEHVVQQGECLASIAARFGQSVVSLWGLAENAGLRALRGDDPYVLAPGDVVRVPRPQRTSLVLATGRRHVIRRIGTLVPFQVTCRHNDAPRANLGFTLELRGMKGQLIHGTSEADGTVRADIPATARGGVLRFEDGRGTIAFELGALDPLDTLTGIQARLQSLGYYRYEVDGVFGPRTARAVTEFQRDAGVNVTGQIDDATRAAVERAYGR